MDGLDKLNNLINALQRFQDEHGKSITKRLRAVPSKEERLNLLLQMEPAPNPDTLRKLHQVAITEEDYETCEAFAAYAKMKGFEL